MKELKGFLIDVKNNKYGAITLYKDNTILEQYHKILNCDCIDIVQKKINGKYFDIVCDDEGLFKTNPKVSALNKNLQAELVGNLFICKVDLSTAEEISLNDEEINFLYQNLAIIVDPITHQENIGIINIEY